MACLPSVQVIMVALVSDTRCGPGVFMGSVQAAARTVMPRTTIHRADARDHVLSPYYRWPTGHRTVPQQGGSYSVVHGSLENSMRLASAAPLIMLIAGVHLFTLNLQNEQLAARCNELGAIFDRYGTRRSEGSGGPDMIRLGPASTARRAATPRASRRSKICSAAIVSPIRRPSTGRRTCVQLPTTPMLSISTTRPGTASALTATRVEVTT